MRNLDMFQGKGVQGKGVQGKGVQGKGAKAKGAQGLGLGDAGTYYTSVVLHQDFEPLKG